MSSTAPQVRSQRRRSVRNDLQGLRGMGIVFVIVGHLWSWPPSVYGMIDMFFMLSGFLITGVLIDSITKHGGISLTAFYLSRLRRLMPMATLVIVATIAAFYFFFSPAVGAQVAEDGIWALLVVVNWHFYADSTNYFADTSGSPLLHYWSLSIEEQFYMVWPLLLLVVALVAARRNMSQRTVLFGAIGLVTVASFVYSTWHSAAAPGGAYFSTFDRVWEFGVGGLLAAGRPYYRRLSNGVGLALGWLGVVGVVVAAFVPIDGLAFPAPWALPILIPAALVMVGGHGRSSERLWIVNNRPMVYLGDISYSVYLWHLPVNLLLEPYFAKSDPRYYVLAIGATALLSVASYHLVERPLRYAPQLMTRREKQAFARRVRTKRVRLAVSTWAGSVAVALLVLLVVSQTPPTYVPAAATGSAPRALQATDDVVDQQQARLLTALEQDEFPQLVPPIEEQSTEQWKKSLERVACSDVSPAKAPSCRFGRTDAPRTAVVVGDSIAMSWMPAIREALEPKGWQIQQLTLQECTAWTLPSYVDSSGRPSPACAAHHVFVERFMKQERPELLILTSGLPQTANAGRAGLPTDKSELARVGLLRALQILGPAAKRTAVLSPVPLVADVASCATRVAGPELCVEKNVRGLEGLSQVTRGETDAAAQTSAKYINVADWFCVASSCPSFVGRTPVTVDGVHMSVEYARQLAPLLAVALEPGRESITP